MKKIVLGILVLLSFTGCALSNLSNNGPQKQLFLLRPEIAVQPATGKAVHSVLVNEATSTGVLATQKILYGSDSLTRDFYQLAIWTEPPSKALTTVLLKAIDQSSLFTSVASNSSGAVADLSLNTKLLEFYHDTEHQPGKAVVEVRFELLDMRSARVLRSTTLHKEIPVDEYSAKGAVKGLTKGSEEIVSELVRWLGQ